MAGQETLKRHNGPVERPGRVIRRNMADLTHDAITLLELQTSLFKLDLKEISQRSSAALAVLAAGIGTLLASATIALAAFGYLLSEFGGFSQTAAFAISAVTGIVISGLMLIGGWLMLRNGFGAISRSREEFQRNLQWFKSVLKEDVYRNPGED